MGERTRPEVHEVRDCHGRRYRVGEDPVTLTGRPRASMVWFAAGAMAGVGVLQYGFGAAAPALMDHHGWGLAGTFWLLAAWTVFQAGVGFPTAHLRERGRIGPGAVMVTGAALCAIGVLALAYAPGLVGALLGYSVLGGTGAGLVYAASTSTVAKWYPERSAARVSLVTGAFAYGSVPVVVAVVLGLDAATLVPALTVAAGVLFVLIVVCGRALVDPPARWWPAEVDPQAWGLGGMLNPGRRHNPPAVREYSTRQALRTGALPIMSVILLGAGAVSLFNVAFLVLVAGDVGSAAAVVAVAAGLLVGVNGAGRAVAVGISERLGRRRTLGAVLGVQAVAQVLLALAVGTGSAGVLLGAAVLAGVGGGAFYPLFACLAREYFGEHSAIEVHGIVYGAKAGSGLLGVGLAGLALLAWGPAATFMVAALVSGASMTAVAALRRPGFPNTLPGPPTGAPVRRDHPAR